MNETDNAVMVFVGLSFVLVFRGRNKKTDLIRCRSWGIRDQGREISKAKERRLSTLQTQRRAAMWGVDPLSGV